MHLAKGEAKMISVILPAANAEGYTFSARTLFFSVYAILKKNGFNPDFYDFFDDQRGFDRFLSQNKRIRKQGHIFILAVFLNTWKSAFGFLRNILTLSMPGIKVILIGPYAAFFYDVLLKEGLADIVVLADADVVMPRLLATGFSPSLMNNLPNLAFKSKGTVVCNQVRWSDDLDNIPFLSPYFLERPDLPVIILTSRGCRHSCAFCDNSLVWGGRFRSRTLENVFEELEMLKRAGVREIVFGDSNFLSLNSRVMALCREMIKRRMGFLWTCDARVDSVSPEILRVMHLAGCRAIGYGVESGSFKVRRSLGKYFSNRQVERAITWAKETGIAVDLYLLLGAPGEDRDALIETRDFLRKTAPVRSVSVNLLSLSPGSRLCEDYFLSYQQKKEFVLNQKAAAVTCPH